MMEKTFMIDGAVYSYVDTGQKELETLVLLHGFTGTKQTWIPHIKKWEKHYRLIAIDLPGHGKTKTQSSISMVEFSRHLDELLKKEVCESVHLLGYSMGGRAALSFAMKYDYAVKTLIIESASPGLKTEKERRARRNNDENLANKLLASGIGRFVTEWERIPLFASQKLLPHSVQQNIRQVRLSQHPKGLSNSLKYMGTGAQPSWWPLLNQLHVKTLLIVGEWDEKYVQINEEMAEKLSHSQLVIVKEAGHTVHLEQTEKFVKIVLDFIKKEKGLS